VKNGSADNIMACMDLVLPFGSTFKGELIEEIPSWYLKWGSENFDDKLMSELRISWCEVFSRVWSWREENDEHI